MTATKGAALIACLWLLGACIEAGTTIGSVLAGVAALTVAGCILAAEWVDAQVAEDRVSSECVRRLGRELTEVDR